MRRFDKHARVFQQHQQHLESIAAAEWENLSELHNMAESEGVNSEAFCQLHQMLNDLGIIFDFDWMNSVYSKRVFNDNDNFSTCDLIELSIYFTVIFRSDQFNDGCIVNFFRILFSEKYLIGLMRLYERKKGLFGKCVQREKTEYPL
jgi:hypothetical protein